MSQSIAAHLLANLKDIVASPHYRSTAFYNIQADLVSQIQALPSYQEFFGDLEAGAVDPDRSLLSPAAYFVDLMRFIDKYITTPNRSTIPSGSTLQKRRPDLWEIPLDRENTETEVPYLQFVNEVLTANLGTDTMQAMASAPWPFNLPYNAPLEQIRTYLRHFKTDLAAVYKTFNADPLSIAREQLGLSYDECKLITAPDPSATALNAAYGLKGISVQSLGGLDQVEVFMAQTGLSRPQLQELIYQGLGEDEIKTGIPNDFFINQDLKKDGKYLEVKPADQGKSPSERIENLNLKVLDRLQRFIRLANKTGWSFSDLDWALRSTGATEIDGNAIQNLAKIKELKDRFDLPLDVLCSFWYDMKSIGVGAGPVPNDLFDRVFTPPTAFVNNPVRINLWWGTEVKYFLSPECDGGNHFLGAPHESAWDKRPMWLIPVNPADPGAGYLLGDGDWLLSTEMAALRYKGNGLLLTKDQAKAARVVPVFDEVNRTIWFQQHASQGTGALTLDTRGFIAYFAPFQATTQEPQFQLFSYSLDFPGPNTVIRIKLAAALKVSDEESTQIAISDQPIIQLTVSKLTEFYRVSKLASTLGLRVNEYFLLLRLLGKPSVAGIEDVIELANWTGWLKTAGFSVYQLQYLLLGEKSPYVNSGYADADIEQLNDDLQKTAKTWFEDTFAQKGGDKQTAETIFDTLVSKKILSPIVVIFDTPVSSSGISELFPNGNIDLINETLSERSIGPRHLIIEKLASFFKVETPTLQWLLTLCKRMVGAADYFDLLARTLTLANFLQLTAVEIQNISEHPGWFGIDDIQKGFTLSDIRTLYTFKQMTQAFHDASNQMLDYFHSKEEDKNTLCKLTGWSVTAAQLGTLKQKFGLSEKGQKEPLKVKSLAQFKACFDLAGYLGVNIEFLVDLASPSASGSADQATWDKYNSQATALLHTLNAKYDTGQWENIYPPIVARLNEQTRDTLANLLMWRLNQQKIDALLKEEAEKKDGAKTFGALLKTKPLDELLKIRAFDDLYGYLLMDVQMGGCMDISRIKLGINSLQLYIQRCRMNLEAGVVQPIPEKEWAWMAHYQLWAANRKVFLYPENYIDPSLRRLATPLYADLKNELLQNEITDANVEKAYNHYFEKFEEVARLKIVDACYADVYDPGAGKTASTLFLIGRTHTTPYTYYFRSAVFVYSGSDAPAILWDPWQKIDVSIPADTVSAVYAFEKLFVFWVEQTTERHPTSTDGKTNIQTKATIKYSFQKISQNWVQPQELIKDVVIYDDAAGDWKKTSVPSALCWKKVSILKLEKTGSSSETIYILYGQIDCDEKLNGYKSHLPFTALTGDLRAKTVDVSLSVNVITAIQRNNVYLLPFENIHRWPLYDVDKYAPDETGGALGVVHGQIPLISQPNFPGGERNVAQFGFPNYISVDGITIPEDFTLEAWIYYDPKEATYRPFLSKPTKDLSSANNRTAEFDFQVSLQHCLDFFMGSGGDTEYGVDLNMAALTQKTWHHVAVTMNGGTATMYLDGKSVGSKTFQGGQRQRGTLPLLIGHYYNDDKQNPHHYWSGYMADVCIWDGAATKEQISALYNWKKGIATNSLLPDTFQITNRPPWSVWDTGEECFLVIPEKQTSQPTLSLKDSRLAYDTDPGVTQNRRFIRLTTSVIETLSRKMFASGIDHLLTLDSQGIAEYPFSRYHLSTENIIPPSDFLDFRGAYGPYFWEIFFHIPFLVANALHTNQRFEEAQKWYQYIFNPTSHIDTADHHPADRFWGFRPFRGQTLEKIEEMLKNSAELAVYEDDPFDPDAIARLRIGAYEKAIVMKYIDNLLGWGDSLFTRDDWESLVQATMCYILADDLLGKKPKQKRLPKPDPSKTFECLSHPPADEAPTPMSFLTSLATLSSISQSFSALLKTETGNEAGPHEFDTGYFRIGENDVFSQYWDKLDKRLYQIRNCMNIAGMLRQLALFEPPIDPRQVMSALASGSGTLSGFPPITQVPHYRFATMVQQAKGVTSILIELGSALLSALEKRDGEQLALRRSTHEQVVLNLMTQLKQKQIEEEQHNLDSLQQSLDAAVYRYNYYSGLIGSGLLAAETAELALIAAAIDVNLIAAELKGISIAGYWLPTIYGMADGGFHPGDALITSAQVLESAAGTLQQASGMSATIAQYQRRQQDWELQQALAGYDRDQISMQIEAAQVRQAIAQQDLAVHHKSIEQAQEILTLLKGKFTNQDLYEWMVGQLASLYFQTYKIAFSLAQAAEKAYQYERNTDETYIQPGYWDSLKKGLLTGESLMLSLNQLEKAYLDGNARELEIEKTISLLQLAPEQLLALKTTGQCTFGFGEQLFDLDFPGHYCRKIKSIAITIPALVGPYQNIPATLTQNYDRTVLKTDLEAVKFLLPNNDGSAPPATLRCNWRPNQQIAISRGVADSGLFELNFHDERYLPFEGTGAVSEWTLSLPRASNRNLDFNSITDVIIQLQYTALDGGKGFHNQVTALEKIKNFSGYCFVSLANEFPSEWKNFKTHPDMKTPFKLPANKFPVNLKLKFLQITYAVTLPLTPKQAPQPLKSAISIDQDTLQFELSQGVIHIGADTSDVLLVILYSAELNWSG